jgi:hypothetical protein
MTVWFSRIEGTYEEGGMNMNRNMEGNRDVPKHIDAVEQMVESTPDLKKVDELHRQQPQKQIPPSR